MPKINLFLLLRSDLRRVSIHVGGDAVSAMLLLIKAGDLSVVFDEYPSCNPYY